MSNYATSNFLRFRIFIFFLPRLCIPNITSLPHSIASVTSDQSSQPYLLWNYIILHNNSQQIRRYFWFTKINLYSEYLEPRTILTKALYYYYYYYYLLTSFVNKLPKMHCIYSMITCGESCHIILYIGEWVIILVGVTDDHLYSSTDYVS